VVCPLIRNAERGPVDRTGTDKLSQVLFPVAAGTRVPAPEQLQFPVNERLHVARVLA
jgi:hypothetical protein